MRPIGSRFELRMKLAANKPWMVRQFNHFDDLMIWGEPAQHHPAGYQNIPVMIINLITMTVPFMNKRRLIGRIGARVLMKDAGIQPQPHGSVRFFKARLIWHQVNDRVFCIRIKF